MKHIKEKYYRTKEEGEIRTESTSYFYCHGRDSRRFVSHRVRK